MEEIRRKLSSEGLTINKQSFNTLLKRIVYTGKIMIKKWRDEDETIVEGLHERIISDELFNKVQNIINEKKVQPTQKKTLRPEFPLRGHLLCIKCKKLLTASFSTSGNGNKHGYYHCNYCKQSKSRFKAKEINTEFEYFLSSFSFNPKIIELYRLVLTDVRNDNKININKRLKNIKIQIKEMEKKKEKAQDLLLNNSINGIQYKEISDRFEQNILDLDWEGHKLRESNKNQADQISFGLNLLNNLITHYKESNIELKNKLIGSIFPTKLFYFQKYYRTANPSIIEKIVTLKNKDLESEENEKAIENDGSSIRAPVAGLEPATRGLTVHCSNQLSYTGKFFLIKTRGLIRKPPDSLPGF